MLPDWVEHVMETDAEPYLRTPDEELSFIVRHNLDVNASVAAMVTVTLFALWRIVRVAGHTLLKRRKQKHQ